MFSFNKRLAMPASLVFLLLFNLLARVIVLLFTDLGID